jgi:hypothetical protein
MRVPLFICAALAWALPITASAQSRTRPAPRRPPSIELGVGVLWTGSYDAGNAAALETRNPSTGQTSLTLFNTESRMRSAVGIDAHLGYRLTSRWSAEGLFQYSRPVLRTDLSNDFESAATTLADETITSYLAGGSVVYHFGRGRLRPFLSGGAGYLRQLDEGGVELLTGTELHGGGGLKYWFGTRRQRFGLRIDAGLSVRDKSKAFEQKRRTLPVFAAGFTSVF